MRYLFLSLLLNLPLLFGPAWAVAEDPNKKAASSLQPPAADRASTDSNAGADSDKADSEKADKPDAEQPKRPQISSRPTSMSIIPEPGGQKALTIHFRWSLYPKASVEVRLVPGSDGKGATVAPIYFSEHLSLQVREALYTCLDHLGEGGRIHSFTKNKIVYDMIGRRNSLGNQGVHVEVHAEDSKTPEVNPAAAYLQLDTWAVDPETLSLDLPRDAFARSGTLFVWFFRGDQVVWQEQIRWPGY